MPSVYFDTNVYSYASTNVQTDEVRAWLDEGRYTAVASNLNLIELARTQSRVQAIEFVGALTRIARKEEEPPFTMLLADEFLKVVEHARPRWSQKSGWASRSKWRRSYREKWKAVRAAPEQALVGLPEFNRHHQPIEQGLFDEQAQLARLERKRKQVSIEQAVAPRLRRLVGDQLADRVDALPAAERFVRLTSLEDWAVALSRDESGSNDLGEWTDGHIKPPDERALAEFWLNEIALKDVPHHTIRGLVRHFQPTREVKLSNRNDLDQANWLLRVDVVVTADKGLAHLLVEAREQLRRWVPQVVLARVALLVPTGNTPSDLQGAFAAAR